jgi:F-type H+-transporting ATPase subunit delta
MAAVARFCFRRFPRIRVGFVQKRGLAEAEDVSSFPLMFSTPRQAFFSNTRVIQVDVPATSGNFGILPKHVPSLAVLRPGVVTVYEQDKKSKYFVSSGIVTVLDDASVQIVAEEAAPLENLDPQAVRSGLEEAQQQLVTTSSEEAKAEAMIAIEVHEAMAKAIE